MRRTGTSNAYVLSGLGLACTAVAALAFSPPRQPDESPDEPTAASPAPDDSTPRSEWVTAVEPKPISGQVTKGLQWLVEHQHESGGWDQGDAQLRHGEAAAPNWKQYLRSLSTDPWNNQYQYISPGRNNTDYDIYSFGADGQEGGDGLNADIGSWDLN